jgi:hypothetical protein
LTPPSAPKPAGEGESRAALQRTGVDALTLGSEAPLPAAQGSARERCPDELLPHGSPAVSSLAVRVEDARLERRNLLPLDLSSALNAGPSVREPASGYLAQLLIDGYSAPRLFRRLDAPRSEWAAGHLQARLVVHDLRAGRVLCQVPLRVRGDASGAPISRRMRESTRTALETKLYARTREAMIAALGSISSVLRLAHGAALEDSARGS